jgi:hypothetical protein
MKKLLTGIVVLVLANMAFAVPAFLINGGNDIVLTPGVPTVVPITASDATGIAGMTLNLETQSPVQITKLEIDSVAGLAFFGNSSGANIFTQDNGTPPDAAIGDVTVAPATTPVLLNLDGNKVALVTLLTNVDLAGGNYTLTTANGAYEIGDSKLLLPSGDGLAGVGQSTVAIIPEPVSALLLLAGLPLIRRRRA